MGYPYIRKIKIKTTRTMLNKTFKKTVIILFVMLFSNSLDAQTLVYGIPLEDMKTYALEREKYIIDISKKISNSEATIEIEEFFDLYYCSAYLGGYSPYGERLSMNVVYNFLKEKNYKQAIGVSKNLLNSNPGFIEPLYYIGLAYDRMGDTTNAEIYLKRFYDFLSVPFFSGTGESVDSAFVVRSINDEYLIIKELGLEFESQALIFENNIPYDILYVKSDDGNSIPIYFNIEQPFLLGLKFGDDNDNNDDKNKKVKKKKKKK